jgi:lipoprotein-anchoring transpeptidase ErfK/SrfK
MNKFKKIIDIIVIGLAIAVLVVLGDRIIKIGDDVQDGKYPVYEQENTSEIISDEETTLDSNNTVAALSLNMEIDQSLFQERKDFLAAAPAEEKENIAEVPEEKSDPAMEASGETAELENDEISPENTETPDNDDPAQEVSEEDSIGPEDKTSIMENIDYSDNANFRIEIDLSRQRLTVFYREDILKEMICSGGALETPTPLGEFTTNQKIEYSWVDRFDVGAYYWIRFFEDYLIHSVPFDENGEMIVEEFEKLGNPASHGCVRLRLDEAKWLYETLPLGVKVLIY